jgi:rod shape-determining protein MreC
MAIYSAGRRRTMLILLLSSILLITLDLRGNAVFNGVRTAFNYALRPFEIAGEVVTRPVERAWDGITRVDDLERENELLQEQLDRQRADQVAAQAAIQENQELKALLGIESLSSFDTRTCRIVGSSPSNFDQRVEIDCGSLDGLKVGMPVVNDAGLVGKITALSLDTSVVMLTTDPLYTVPVKVMASPASGSSDDESESEPPPTVPSGLEVDDVTTTTSTTTTSTTSVPPTSEAQTTDESATGETGETGETGDAVTGSSVPTTGPDGSVPPGTTTTTTLVPPTRETGKLDGFGGRLLPRVSLIDESQAFGRIEVGDAILTAGGSDSLAPPDIPIGVVANVITRAGVGGIELEVELNADLDRLNFLTVILYTAPREAGGLG